MNLRELLETQSKKDPDKVFLYFGEQQVTYKEFDENVNRAANAFLSLGLQKGDRVCFFLPNCPEYLYGWLGLAKIGAILVPINTNYKTEEMRYILDHSEANTLLVHASLKGVVETIRPETPSVRTFSLSETRRRPAIFHSKRPFGTVRRTSDLRISETRISAKSCTPQAPPGPPKGS